jgi:hypothetical protein
MSLDALAMHLVSLNTGSPAFAYSLPGVAEGAVLDAVLHVSAATAIALHPSPASAAMPSAALHGMAAFLIVLRVRSCGHRKQRQSKRYP